VNEFLQTALTFPTVVFSVLLAVSAVYWLLAATGLSDADFSDGLAGADGDPNAGDLLSRVGLTGVPVMVVLTVLSFTAWFGTYFVHLLVLRGLSEEVRTAAGVGTLLGMCVLSVPVTAAILWPVRRGLNRLRIAPPDASIVGRSGVVITPTLSAGYGQVSVDDGGAGLILQARCDDADPLERGDRVVLIEYLEGQNAYRVVAEHHLLGR
jgi:hypothetical protein